MLAPICEGAAARVTHAGHVLRVAPEGEPRRDQLAGQVRSREAVGAGIIGDTLRRAGEEREVIGLAGVVNA